MSSPLMDLHSSVASEDNFNACDSPSGSSTSEPHDDVMKSSFIDQSLFYKLDQLSPDNPLYFMQQQNTSNMSSLVDPLLPNSTEMTSTTTTTTTITAPTFWSGINTAIPNLAKNFTDYLTGYSMQQQFNLQ
ncbi:uncharacterized protein BX663DRAFT_509767 [Cokeromyces recurvatus]|uniref:uncharacterized protein n=1 Tax=Cokeromyces recurvatus TaxID=90255 RepID=UPI00221E8C83|nr:uncharacterized protein BX663DRAFT_509767 [Cokeromyces recurvatus]KAI7902590.1 hypothetical protein BX663DRAFT_509767 [Cokeromyces recurvatus]